MQKRLWGIIFFLIWVLLSPEAFPEGKRQLVYFYTSCLKCRDVEKTILPKIPSDIEILWAHAEDPCVLGTLLDLSKGRNVLPPAIYFGGKVYSYRETKTDLLFDVLRKETKITTEPFRLNTDKREQNLFKSFTPFLIFISGVTDGINPCAFVTLLFFLSYLQSLDKKTFRLFLLGFSFITSVFLTYSIIGIAGHKLVEAFSRSSFFTLFNDLMLALTGLLFFLSIFDGIETLKAREENIFLKLPKSQILKIHGWIRHFFPRETNKAFLFLCLAAFASGSLISLVELICTGQIYLPVIKIIYEESKDALKMKAFLYLLLYNGGFILPLCLLLFGYAGIRGTHLTSKVKWLSFAFRLGLPLVLLLLFLLQIRAL